MKKILCVLLSVIACLSVAFTGCAVGSDGRDGKDLNIYDIYEATNSAREEAGQSRLEFLDFLEEYLSQINVSYSDSSNLQALINRTLLSAVSVISEFTYRSSVMSRPVVARCSGAGVVVESDASTGDAYIVTNCHVVYEDITDGGFSNIPNNGVSDPEFAGNIYVYPYGNDYNYTGGALCELIGASLTYDIALLKLTGSGYVKSGTLRAAEFSEAEEVYLGEPVFAVGNPEAAGLSATSGIISRDTETITLEILTGDRRKYRVIRTDTAVNGGNSGGGLFDYSGKIVGIINSKLTGDDIDNMSYALPAANVKRLWKLFKDGYGSTGSAVPQVKHATFPEENFEYVTSTYYDSSANLVRVTDTVTVQASYNGLIPNDKILGIQVVRGGEVVDEVTVTRYYNINDVLLSAREGDMINYRIIRPSLGTEERTVSQRAIFTTSE